MTWRVMSIDLEESSSLSTALKLPRTFQFNSRGGEKDSPLLQWAPPGNSFGSTGTSYGVTQTIFCETAPAIGSGYCLRPLPPCPLRDAALLMREANRQGPPHL